MRDSASIKCDFEQAGDAYRCRKCGRVARAKSPPFAVCRSAGLGDLVKSGLSAAGITEERVSKIIGRPCGCGARAEALNRLGAKLGIGGKPAKDA